MLEFEWDEAKNVLNRKKHQVWFEEAQTVFNDENCRVFIDDDHCYRKNDKVIRIISARKATNKERSVYEERI
ncbi:MAG: BrnT family toxin [Oligoflexia bacterium]|nr:BrnT family toxin [Oligoflexia bacterium]